MMINFEKIGTIKPREPSEEDDWEPPSHKERGSMLVHVGPVEISDNFASRDYEVIDHDGCTFWIQEGVGFDYWLDQLDWPERGGYFYISDISVTYTRGDGYTTDDDEAWDHPPPRRVYWWWRLWQWMNGREMP